MSEINNDVTMPEKKEQSPIDIRRQDIGAFGKLAPLRFGYSTSVDLTIVNSGSPATDKDIEMAVPANAAQLMISDETFDLFEIHFHGPSEHVINKNEFAMEMHMVHRSTKDQTLLVVGRWIVEGAFNNPMNAIFANIPQKPNSSITISNFDLNALLPTGKESFRYMGSLTTGKFIEGVRWVVLAEKMPLSAQQIAAFTGLFPNGNRRGVMPINDRVVLTDVI